MGLKDNLELDPAAKKSTWFTRENRVFIVILSIALGQGLSGVADFSYLYKDNYGLDPAEVASLTSFITIPWLIKPLWGLISDRYPLFGYRRKTYLVLMASICATSFLLLGRWSISMYSGITFIFIISFTLAFSNVIGEALIVESSQNYSLEQGRTEEEKQAQASRAVSLFFGVRSFGNLISSYFSGYLQQIMDKKVIYQFTSLLPMTVACLGFTLPENRANDPRNQLPQNSPGDENEELVARSTARTITQENTLEKIKNFVSQPQIYKPIGVLFLFMITPSASTAMFYFYTNELGFDPEFIGELRFVSAAASISGILIFNRFLKNVEFKKIFFWSTIICFFLSLTQIMLVTRTNLAFGIPDKAFCLGDSLIVQVIGEINMMPVLAIACRLCPKNIEGTMYALMMSVINLGGVISGQLGALCIWLLGITENNFTNLWALLLISCIFCVIPLPLLNVIEFDKALEITEKEGVALDQDIPVVGGTDEDDMFSLGTIASRQESEEIY